MGSEIVFGSGWQLAGAMVVAAVTAVAFIGAVNASSAVERGIARDAPARSQLVALGLLVVWLLAAGWLAGFLRSMGG